MNFKPRAIFSFMLLFGLLAGKIACAQLPGTDYDKEWKEVDQFMKKELPKSALARIKTIYSQAKREKKDAQQIKALVYLFALQSRVSDRDNQPGMITDFEKQSDSSSGPAWSILKSFLAELYIGYYQQHRWELYNRTNTRDFKKDDIATWTMDDFHRKITSLFLESLKNKVQLQQTSLGSYEPILEKGNMRHLRPTLFDLLAHQAIDYFAQGEADLSNPAYSFEIDDSRAFSPAPDFVQQKFSSKDSSSMTLTALRIYQDLLSFHLHDPKPDALIDVDLDRIGFVSNKAVQPDKESLYLAALNHIARQYENLPAASQALYLVARQYSENAATYQPYEDSTHRFDYLEAKKICEQVLQQKDSSEGKVNCGNLLLDINRKDLKFQLEKVNLPGQPFRALVQYRNFSQLYLRLIKSDHKAQDDEFDYYDQEFWKKLIARPSVRDWQQSLPDPKDMQEHAAEIKIDSMPAGSYVMLMSTDPHFATKSLLGARIFYVSTISYVNNGQNYFVLNRETGQPLVGATVQAWISRYDNRTSRYISEKAGRFQTDATGFFNFEQPASKNTNDRACSLEISYKTENLFMNDAVDNYYYNNNQEEDTGRVSVFLFTDRSIYRPGQTLFFKGIAVKSNPAERKNSIRENYNTTIYLQNANNESIDSMVVKTNGYGSFSGKFQLPQSGLNGEFTLVMKNGEGSANISVEEYKRPKFYVDYEKLKGSFGVNDKIRVEGIAKAYAGNNIDGALVKYRVVRQPRIIYTWMWWKGWQPPTGKLEIVHGEAKTGKDGKFEIEFTAIPDLAIDKKFDPVFDYTVYADVTDINGETRSGQTTVSVSYQSVMITVAVPEKLPVDSFGTISISTTNLAGEYVPAKINLNIYQLKTETRLIRERFWQRPDQFAMTRDEYIKWFPHDEYDNETDEKSWERVGLIINKEDSSRKNSQVPIAGKKLEPGFYLVEVSTKDRNGQEVKELRFLELYDETTSRLSRPEYLWAEYGKPIEPGEKTSIKIGSSAPAVYLIQQVEKSNSGKTKDDQFSFLKLDNEKKSIVFTAKEADRGGFGVQYFFVKENRFYQQNELIDVPWKNKELNITYETFHDKTLPGSEEKWKVKIAGYKGDRVAAEMMVSMYDASLDQFKMHSWYEPGIWPGYAFYSSWSGDNFTEAESNERPVEETLLKDLDKRYESLFGNLMQTRQVDAFNVRGAGVDKMTATAPLAEKKPDPTINYKLNGRVKYLDLSSVGNLTMSDSTAALKKDENNPAPAEFGPVQVRKNFNETAFFFPDLYTDSTGAIEFSFTVPDALTKWKLQTLAHSKELAFGTSSKEMLTQKQLMVQPNAPRFLREGDHMEFSAKIVNLTDSEFTGQAQLLLIDPTTNQSIDGWFQNMYPNQYFTVAAGESQEVKFPIQVPYLFNKALLWRVVARSGNFSDGEEDAMPVLTNKTLVTETLPLNMKGNGTKQFSFDKLLNGSESETLQNYSLTVEYTSNPAWYAVQSLPYLAEYPYECAEQTWNRYFANSLASTIANSSPRIKQIFEDWKTKDTAALLSNLQKNQELKSVLLEETPWVLEAKSEEQQKKNIALLFDMVKMSGELKSAITKLSNMQSENGGFVWFTGGPDDRYITQYILTGMGHLKKLKAIAPGEAEALKNIFDKAIPYLDRKMNDDYRLLLKSKINLKKYVPGSSEVQYFYVRSFFPDYPVEKEFQTAFNYFRKQIQTSWTGQSKYMEGMIALALYRTGDTKTPADILRSLKQTAIRSEELGTYWKTEAGWFWYQAPIETQALMIEVFQEIGKDAVMVNEIKTWLLKNKQTNNWKTTRATAEACYALLLQGADWLKNEPSVNIKLGATEISANAAESGIGYFKKTIEGEKMNSSMGNISVSVNNSGPAKATAEPSWGSVYWQYFENLDKITSSATPLQLSKKLFVEKNTDRGPVLTPVNENDELHVGDKIKVWVELRVDRDMEYVHMKDMRASCLEPVNVLSEYKWQGGLGYYESTLDASTNFFFDRLSKGTYVFEYSLFVSHTGNFSNGITSIQCMYAPEFTAHSEGIRITVVE